MHARKLFATTVTSAVAFSAIALTTAPAHAAYTADPDDTAFTPTSADLIGVGSDTSQHALKLLADGYNATSPAARVATYAALGGGTIPLPGAAEITRPNGSGAGKALLYGAGNNNEIDFARSSSAINTAEASAQLQAFPFALDTLVMAVSKTVPSNAPASLTPAQIVDIYEGNITNWNQIGGTSGTIAPKIPQAGSGTRSFFEAQLKAMNEGVAVTLGASVAAVQEHSDADIKGNPNAIAPFSEGRAGLLGQTLRLEAGWKADRALYNVVRGTAVGNANVLAVFGKNGYLCSTDARPLIEAAGFKQLATDDFDGVCGLPTQSATSNFTLNERVVTTTTLTVTSTVARTARLTARVTGSTSPSGTVAFYDGETLLGSGIPLTSGQAVLTKGNVAPGAHSYYAVFTPAGGSAFEPSEDTGAGVVKTSSTITESFPASVKAGKRARGAVTVVLAGVSAKATGLVKVMRGAKVLASKRLANGKVVIVLPKLKVGANNLKVVWAGDGVSVGSQKVFKIKQAKAKKKKKK
ncbi:substrate-binding domain-containing protein [Nocardioides lijunqiniae]|uniref:substrate-binding domain-containing protein n=1 Tax=Nocardioides lijunqiniae TaxID=2760832 RepID=UPI001878012C|nr:substrate-binding domain-containing protein [Nocardioides lijunqiniae]